MAKVISFGGTDYTKKVLESANGPACVELYGKLHSALKLDGEPPKRFATSEVARARCWKLLEQYAAANASAAKEAVEEKAPKAPKAPKAEGETTEKKPRVRQGTNLTPHGDAPEACRAGSKQAALVDAMSKKGGATMEELLTATSFGKTPWKPVSVRAAFGWDLRNKGYGVRSNFSNPDGVERFELVVPEGFSIPAHASTKLAEKEEAKKQKAAEKEAAKAAEKA